jgi:hypothetical protein
MLRVLLTLLPLASGFSTSISLHRISGAGTRLGDFFASFLNVLPGVGGEAAGSESDRDDEREDRTDRAGVEGMLEREKRVTVAVSLLSWRAWARVREPDVEGRERE